MKTLDSKNASFRRLALNRTNNSIKAIRLLGNLSNKHNYSYTEEEFKRIFTSVEEEIKLAKSKYLIALNKNRRFRL